jgi:hypothetical protein
MIFPKLNLEQAYRLGFYLIVMASSVGAGAAIGLCLSALYMPQVLRPVATFVFGLESCLTLMLAYLSVRLAAREQNESR